MGVRSSRYGKFVSMPAPPRESDSTPLRVIRTETGATVHIHPDIKPQKSTYPIPEWSGTLHEYWLRKISSTNSSNGFDNGTSSGTGSGTGSAAKSTSRDDDLPPVDDFLFSLPGIKLPIKSQQSSTPKAAAEAVDASPAAPPSSSCMQKEVQYARSNHVATHAFVGNAFSSAILEAYNTHGEIILSPDDVWLVVTLHFSQYVNDHAEEVRSIFVSHQGKKKLIMHEPLGVTEEEWGGEFFPQMFQLISENLKSAPSQSESPSRVTPAQVLLSDFSTTGEVERLISFGVTMDSFQKYFEYGRSVRGCGFKAVTLLGVEADWVKLTEKLLQLKEVMASTPFVKYLTRLEPIFASFLQTYRANPADSAAIRHFWDYVADGEMGIIGSGGETALKISGWLVAFFDKEVGKEKMDADDMNLRNIDCPIQLLDLSLGITSNCKLLGGMHGVHYDSEAHSYRACQSLAVVKDLASMRRMCEKDTQWDACISHGVITNSRETVSQMVAASAGYVKREAELDEVKPPSERTSPQASSSARAIDMPVCVPSDDGRRLLESDADTAATPTNVNESKSSGQQEQRDSPDRDNSNSVARESNVTLKWPNGATYFGPITSDLSRSGKRGRMKYGDGSEFVGAWLNDVPHGIGALTAGGHLIVGQWVKGVVEGKGLREWPATFPKPRHVYKGDFVANQRDGKGEMDYGEHGRVYVGEWLGGKRHGQGELRWNVDRYDRPLTSCVYRGSFIDNAPSQGLLTASNGTTFEGKFTGSRFSGRYHSAINSIEFVGEIDGEPKKGSFGLRRIVQLPRSGLMDRFKSATSSTSTNRLQIGDEVEVISVRNLTRDYYNTPPEYRLGVRSNRTDPPMEFEVPAECCEGGLAIAQAWKIMVDCHWEYSFLYAVV